MTRLVEVSEAVNANIKRVKQVDMDMAPADSVGAVPQAIDEYCQAIEHGDTVIHQTVLACSDLPIAIADDAGVAQYGGVKLYDFPKGLLNTLSAVVSGTLAAGATGTIIDNWDGDVALGTAPATTGATLTGTEADIMPQVAISAGAADKIGVVAAVSVATALTESGARWLDGTATAKDLYLNFVIDDDATHTAGTALFTGTVTLTWINGGAL